MIAALQPGNHTLSRSQPSQLLSMVKVDASWPSPQWSTLARSFTGLEWELATDNADGVRIHNCNATACTVSVPSIQGSTFHLKTETKAVEDKAEAAEEVEEITPAVIDARPSEQSAVLKVFILAGQSNMQGHGLVDQAADAMHADGHAFMNGTLEYLTTDPRTKQEFAKLKHGGAWVNRSDVYVLYNDTQPASTGGPGGAWLGPLSPGFGGDGGKGEPVGSVEMGPELGIGWALGDGLEAPVLLLKTAWGGKSLYEDFRPPSSGGKTGKFYTRMISDVKAALAALPSLFPSAPRKHELAGFFWHQGWNDACGDKPEEYAKDLPNLIRDVRKDLGAPKLPWAVGVSGMGGYRPYSDTQCTGALDVLTDTIIPAQFAVANATLHPEFAGTVLAVETRAFHREARYSPGSQCYHWNNNCESYWRVGQAMGASMLKLIGE